MRGLAAALLAIAAVAFADEPPYPVNGYTLGPFECEAEPGSSGTTAIASAIFDFTGVDAPPGEVGACPGLQAKTVCYPEYISVEAAKARGIYPSDGAFLACPTTSSGVPEIYCWVQLTVGQTSPHCTCRWPRAK